MESKGNITQLPALLSVQPSVGHEVLPVKRQRKWHKKSHYGCSNCKRRKIKVQLFFVMDRPVVLTPAECPENRPSCNNCVKQNAHCEYPPRPSSGPVTLHPLLPRPGDSIQLQSTPIAFNAADMRLFHHFLHTAYPHLPLGNDKAWVTDVALFAHSVSRKCSLSGYL